MTKYLFSRAEGAPEAYTPIDEIGVPMFFQMWGVRQDPFNVLADGDTLWWVDQRSREVRWELRVRNLRRARCSSTAAAFERLRRWFGVLPGDLTAYQKGGRFEGWLLAWEAELVGPVRLLLPDGQRLGRNGFRRIDDHLARSFGLGEPGGPAAIPVEAIEAEPDILAPSRVRHIPLAVRREVFERDQHRCQRCGTEYGPMHLDHIHPWVKGGANTVDNLQVLCASCNLAKGAAADEGRSVVPAVASLLTMAGTLQRDVPDSTANLQSLLQLAVSCGLTENIKTVMWDLFHHGDFDNDVADAVGEALVGVSGELALHAEIFDDLVMHATEGMTAEVAGWLEELLDTADRDIATRAAAYLAFDEGIPKERRLALAERSLSSPDTRVVAVARLVIAELADDDAVWREGLLYAIDHGDAFIASQAALIAGTEVADDVLAYQFLERAMRSPAREIAQQAAQALADLFADQPGVADVYTRKAKELADVLAAYEAVRCG